MGDERINGFWIVADCFYQLPGILISRFQLFLAQDEMGLANIRCLFGFHYRIIYRNVRLSAHTISPFGLVEQSLSGNKLVFP
jgi:hypothetical protein